MMARLLVIISILIVGSLSWWYGGGNSKGKEDSQQSPVPSHASGVSFQVPLQKEETPLSLPSDGVATKTFTDALGGVVPHHLVASSFLAEFFTLLQNRASVPETILLLAPNHGELGEKNIQTVDYHWKTAFGEVATDQRLLQVVEKTGAAIAPLSFEDEHGIYNILPYIAHFLPDTKVVPVIFKYQTSSREIENFSQAVAKEMTQRNIFVVSSVDFSHYLPQGEAERKDKDTFSAIKSFDVSRIARFGSDHLDSPAAVLVLLRLGQILDATQVTLLRHGNSAENIRSRNSSTTSHFTFFLHPKP